MPLSRAPSAGSGVGARGALDEWNTSLYPDQTNFSNGFSSRDDTGPYGITVVAATDVDSHIDWRAEGSGYVFHIAHYTDPTTGAVVAGKGTGSLFGIGIQGDGGGGILLAKDGPKGIGLFVDQKGVVTDAAAVGLRIDQYSRFAPGSYYQTLRPGAAVGLRVLSSGHTPTNGDMMQEWYISHLRTNVAGRVYSEDGSLRWARSLLVDAIPLGTSNVQDARLGYQGNGGRAFIEDWSGMGGSGPATTSSDGAFLRLHANAGGSQKQYYSGALRASKAGQSLRLQVHDGAAHFGNENLQTVLDATPSRVAVTGTNLKLEALTTPAAPTLSTIGTAGSTTYSYRLAYVNKAGTTIAGTAATIATGNATLTASNKVRVTLPTLPPGVTSVKVYGRTSGSELLMATLTVPTRTVSDGIMKAAQTRSVSDAATTSASQVITSATAAFTQDDVGSTVTITGAGFNSNILDTHIISVQSATQATVAIGATKTVSGAAMTILRVASKYLTSATGAFTSSDVGKRVTVTGAGNAGGILYSHIINFVSSTQVVLEDIPLTNVSAATVTIDGGALTTVFDDDGTVTPSGALPSSPAGSKVQLQPWENQTGNMLETLNYAGTAQWGVSSAGLPRWIAAGNEQTTVGAAGAASALPATPTKYLKVVDSTGSVLVVPAYAAS